MTNKPYTYSKRAEKDLIKIYKHTVKEWGLKQAGIYDQGLESTIFLLADNPALGRQSDDIKTGYRRFEYGRHIIFYRNRKSDIFILRILHDSMDAKRHLSP